jgi:hypothetical protein
MMNFGVAIATRSSPPQRGHRSLGTAPGRERFLAARGFLRERLTIGTTKAYHIVYGAKSVLHHVFVSCGNFRAVSMEIIRSACASSPAR